MVLLSAENAHPRWFDDMPGAANNSRINKIHPVAQRYHVTSDTLGREFNPGKRDFSH